MKTLICALYFLLALTANAFAQPFAVMTETQAHGVVTITLFDEPCKLTDKVTNLHYRATWQEPNKTFEGCFGVNKEAGAVAFYFDDGAVVMTPSSAFKPVTRT